MTRKSDLFVAMILAFVGLSEAGAQDSVKVYNGVDGHRPLVRLEGAALTDAMIQNAIAIDGPVTVNVPRFKRMGDGLAAAITRLHPDVKVLREGGKIAIVDIVRMSFQDPKAIMKATDRSPTSAMALLDRLDAPDSSVQLHERIAAAKLAIQSSLMTLQ